ncbi:MAG: hypothetical protein IJ564_02860 [Alphaproteobacteria bacterium]|nr:hypothetical protein [Alphaproteobacteria bacterium]
MKHKIGLKIKAIRQKAKITQEVLAERCNILVEATALISSIKKLSDDQISTLIKVVDALK